MGPGTAHHKRRLGGPTPCTTPAPVQATPWPGAREAMSQGGGKGAEGHNGGVGTWGDGGGVGGGWGATAGVTEAQQYAHPAAKVASALLPEGTGLDAARSNTAENLGPMCFTGPPWAFPMARARAKVRKKRVLSVSSDSSLRNPLNFQRHTTFCMTVSGFLLVARTGTLINAAIAWVCLLLHDAHMVHY